MGLAGQSGHVWVDEIERHEGVVVLSSGRLWV